MPTEKWWEGSRSYGSKVSGLAGVTCEQQGNPLWYTPSIHQNDGYDGRRINNLGTSWLLCTFKCVYL